MMHTRMPAAEIGYEYCESTDSEQRTAARNTAFPLNAFNLDLVEKHLYNVVDFTKHKNYKSQRASPLKFRPTAFKLK